MKKFILMQLILIILPITGLAQDEIDRGYVDITIEYRSMFSGNLQIQDGICRLARDIDCEKARIKATGDSCLQNPTSHQCVEAGALLGSSLCIEGLIFDGRVGSGEKVKVSICESSSGFGNVYVRDTKNGLIWTYYPLLKNNDTIIYP
jgi:hypothetical protein